MDRRRQLAVTQITHTLQVPRNQTALFGPNLDHGSPGDHDRQERKSVVCPCTFEPLLVGTDRNCSALITSRGREEEDLVYDNHDLVLTGISKRIFPSAIPRTTCGVVDQRSRDIRLICS